MKICAKALSSGGRRCGLHPSEPAVSTLEDIREMDAQGSLRAFIMATALLHQLHPEIEPKPIFFSDKTLWGEISWL